MKEQQSLFGDDERPKKPEETAPYQAHSDTSRAAAAQILESAKTLRGKVYRFLKQQPAGEATDEQMQEGTQMNPSTQRPRRVELQEAGLVVDSGRTGTTRSGRRAVIWKVVQL